MNIYAVFPLIATVAYVPLLVITLSTRPWQQRHVLFMLFLIPAMGWSLTDVLVRGTFFPEHKALLFQILLVAFSVMAVQFHVFISSFYTPGQGRWLPFSYVSLGVIIALVAMGYVTGDVKVDGEVVHGTYRLGIAVVFATLLVLAARNYYVFLNRLRILNNPVLYNQIVSLVIGLSVLVISTASILLPWGRAFPTSHFGNLINAFILTYAIVRHQLVDIKIVLR